MKRQAVGVALTVLLIALGFACALRCATKKAPTGKHSIYRLRCYSGGIPVVSRLVLRDHPKKPIFMTEDRIRERIYWDIEAENYIVVRNFSCTTERTGKRWRPTP
jgi:hypothetical protein